MIPARLAATRLPDKPLIEINGKPMVQHVWERSRQAAGVDEVVIATPDDSIAQAAAAFGATAIMTSHEHRSGTDRLAEAATVLGLAEHDIVVNVQGDEPLVDPEVIEALVEVLRKNPDIPMASVMCPCPDVDLDDPACVKVVAALTGQALYFSRSRIPYARREVEGIQVMQHMGMYAYRRGFLARYAALPPTPLEQMEALEQLRVLDHGYSIRMIRTERAPIGVDTPQDLERVRVLLSGP
jgi:3-deoxy-manno-octulosonate cytidylyltransferase (CMP-KDO synthetase)